MKGAVDTEIEVTRPNEDAMISVATVIKHRDGPGGGEIGFNLRQVYLGDDQDGDPVTSCVVEPTDFIPTKKEKPKKLSERLQVILDALRHAVNEEGQPVLDTNGWNVNLKGVPIEVWRAHLLKVEERNPNFKQLWNRRRELIEIGEVMVEGELAWPVTKVTDENTF